MRHRSRPRSHASVVGHGVLAVLQARGQGPPGLPQQGPGERHDRAPRSAGCVTLERGAKRGQREALVVGDPEAVIQSAAWCTGGGQGYIDEAASYGAQLFITGEVSEQTVHVARERGLAFIAAGHHATERFGAQSLGQWIANRFGIDHHFVDIDNPA